MNAQERLYKSQKKAEWDDLLVEKRRQQQGADGRFLRWRENERKKIDIVDEITRLLDCENGELIFLWRLSLQNAEKLRDMIKEKTKEAK